MSLKNAAVQRSVLNFKGNWNASTNTPTLASSVGVAGDQYIVSVAGTTNLNGITTWAVGDTVSFNGTVWQRIPNAGVNAVLSVQLNNGGPQTGAVSLTQANADWLAVSGVSQILNKPTLSTVATSGNYSDLNGKPTIPNGSLSLTTNGSSGQATLSGSSATGYSLNVPVYGNQYQLPNATTTTKGGVIIGSGVDVAADSTISVTKVTSFNGRSNIVTLTSQDINAALGGANVVLGVTGNIVGGTAQNPIVNQQNADFNAASGTVGFIANKPVIPQQLTYSGSAVNSLMAGSNVSLSLQSGSLTISSTGGGTQNTNGNRAVFAYDLSGQSTTTTGDELLVFTFSGNYNTPSAVSYSITLPAHNSYAQQTLNFNIPVGTNAAAAISIFSANIIDARPTYNSTVVGSVLTIDTNSTGNITDTTLIQNGAVTGSVALSVTQGNTFSTLISITDPANSSVYQYAPSSSQSFSSIANSMALGETLPNYWFSVGVTTDSVARLVLESLNDGNVLSANFPVMTITNPNTLKFNRVVIAQGSSSGVGPAVENITGNIVTGNASNPVVNQIQSNWNATSGLGVILGKPVIPAAQIQSDFNQTNSASLDFIKNKPIIPAAQVQSDFNQTDSQQLSFIKNKPTIPPAYNLPVATESSIGGVKANTSNVTTDFVKGIDPTDGSLIFATPAGSSAVVTSVSGNIVNNTNPANPVVNQVQVDWNGTGLASILNRPTIPPSQVQSDFNQTDNQQPSFIKNKPSPYSLPAATSSQLGGVATGTPQTGKFVSNFAANGLAQYSSVPIATTTIAGAVKANAGTAGQFVSGIAFDGSLTYGTPTGAVASVTGNIVSGTTANPVITQVQSDFNATSGLGVILNKPNPYVLPAAQNNVLGGIQTGVSQLGQFVSGFDSDGVAQYATPSGSGGSGGTRGVVALDFSGSVPASIGDEIITFTFSNDFEIRNNGSQWSVGNVSSGSFLGFYYDSTLATPTIFGIRNLDGVWASTDNGVNWSSRSTLRNSFQNITKSGNNLLVGDSNRGVWYSSDNGVTFTQATGIDGLCNSLLAISGNTVVTSVSGTTIGIYYSNNNGLNWTKANAIANITVGQFALAPDGTIYAAAFGNGVRKSTDNGVTWTATNRTSTTKSICVTPDGTIIAGSGTGFGIEYSTNGGVTWTSSRSTGTFNYMHFTGTSVLAADNGSGILRSADLGRTWVSTNLTSGVTYAFAQTNNAIVVGGNNIGVLISTDFGAFSIVLPAHSTYAMQTVSFTPSIGTSISSAISLLSSTISTLRPTYTLTSSGNSLVVDTNSSSNIGDVVLNRIQTIAGSLTLSIQQGGGGTGISLTVISITDPRNGSVYQYSPAALSTASEVANYIALNETLTGYWFYIGGSSSSITRLLLESTITGSISGNQPTVSITNAGNLTITPRTIVSGS